MADTLTLAVDCGGGGIKAAVLDTSGTAHASPVRVPTPYPLPPELLVDTIAKIATDLPAASRVTVGLPGMIRSGVVVHTPHYITRSGPAPGCCPTCWRPGAASTCARRSLSGSACRRWS